MESLVIAGDISAGAAHVEGENSFLAEFFSNRSGTGNPAGRAGKKGVFWRVARDWLKSSRGCHGEEFTFVSYLAPDVIQESLHDGMKVGIHYRRFCTWQDLDERSQN